MIESVTHYLFLDLTNSALDTSKLYCFVYEVTTNVLVLLDSLSSFRRGKNEDQQKRKNSLDQEVADELTVYETILEVLFTNLTLTIEAKTCSKSMFSEGFTRLDMEYLNRTNILSYYRLYCQQNQKDSNKTSGTDMDEYPGDLQQDKIGGMDYNVVESDDKNRQESDGFVDVTSFQKQTEEGKEEYQERRFAVVT